MDNYNHIYYLKHKEIIKERAKKFKLNKKPSIICLSCKQFEKHEAKGLCKKCYNKLPKTRKYFREYQRINYPKYKEKVNER